MYCFLQLHFKIIFIQLLTLYYHLFRNIYYFIDNDINFKIYTCNLTIMILLFLIYTFM